MTSAWFIELESLKKEALDRLASLTPQDRQASPTANSWSPQQVVTHLVQMEENILSGSLSAA